MYVLRADTLTKVGELDGLGKRQRIYAVRFIGALGYVVTFQQMDPLYTLDLRDPAAPRIAGTLELSGYSAYLHPASDRTLIGIGQEATAEGRPLGLQISLFDVSNPSHPRRLAHLVKTNVQIQRRIGPARFPLLATDRHRGNTGDLVDERAGRTPARSCSASTTTRSPSTAPSRSRPHPQTQARPESPDR